MSRLIKSAPHLADQLQSDKKIISIKVFKPIKNEEELENISINIGAEAQGILEEAKLEAESIVNSAKQEADLLLQQLEVKIQSFEIEKENIKNQAREAGFALGLDEGREKGYKEYHEVIQSAQDVVESAKKDYRNHVESSESEILEIGVKVAQRILGKQYKKTKKNFYSSLSAL